MNKNHVAMELMFEGSRQEYVELSKKDLERIVSALNVVLSFEQTDGKTKRSMNKIKKLLKSWKDNEECS